MTVFHAEVRITPRPGLLDPEGTAVEHALHSLEFGGVDEVRVGRLVRLRLKANTEGAAREHIDAMCRKLLANPVTEDYEIALRQEA